MPVQKFAYADAKMERSPGQDDEVYVGNVVDGRDGSAVSIGFGRWGPGSALEETMTVDDIMIVLEGSLTVSDDAGTVTAGPGEIVRMPKGAPVRIVAGTQGATTAFVTHPHWEDARG